MRFGVLVSQASRGRTATLDELIAQVASLAASGFHTAWFAQMMGIDALTAIAVAGRAVPDIELGTAVVPVYTRHPIAMAQQALTTQAAIDGQLALGIGLSHQVVVEDRWGMSFERPAEFMREYVSILQPLLHGQELNFTGKRLTARGQITI